MIKAKIRFIINPISGGKSKTRIPALVMAHLDLEKFTPDFRMTEFAYHASRLANDAIAENVDVIVAVGGDGTINEIAGKLVGSNKIFGIIPFGSGNGLARFLNIPLNTVAAIKTLNTKHSISIDTASLNGMPFFNMAGIGFDARVSKVFAANKKRGFYTYVRMALREAITFRASAYQLNIDGHTTAHRAHAISIANSSQYGNNVHIAPKASVTDGLLDVCIITPFPLYMLPAFAFRIFMGTAERSGMVEIKKGKVIRIEHDGPAFVHIDGESLEIKDEVEIRVNPLSLNVIVSK